MSQSLSSIFEALEKLLTVDSFATVEASIEKRCLALFVELGIAHEPYVLTHGGKELILPVYRSEPRYKLASISCPMPFVEQFKKVTELRLNLSEDSYYMANALASIRNNVNNCAELCEVIPSSLIMDYSIRKSIKSYDKLSDAFLSFRENNSAMFDRVKVIYAKNRLLTK